MITLFHVKRIFGTTLSWTPNFGQSVQSIL
jgi:hypothetical protein